MEGALAGTPERNKGGVGAVILAAGSSSRMGSPKQTLRFRGISLLRGAALAALDAGCSPAIVVTGAFADRSRRELDGLAVMEALNPDWETGMASSVREGLAALRTAAPDATAVIFLLCDQPHVTAGVISRLIDAYHATGCSVVASAYGGSFGVPALFGRDLFDELAGLQGGAGAKQIIGRYVSQAHFIPFAAGEVDVDTPEDFSRLITTDLNNRERPGY